MARAEEDLARAVMVNVISDDLLAVVEKVAAVIASRIDVDANSLVLHKAMSSSYLLVLPELALVDRLVGLR